MSLETWKEEFYPIPAKEMKNKSWRECIQHCRKKFQGFFQKNLRKHGVKFDFIFSHVQEKGRYEPWDNIPLNPRTCALCVKARHCRYCILVLTLSNLEDLNQEHCVPVCDIFFATHNPTAAIALLDRTLKTMEVCKIEEITDNILTKQLYHLIESQKL
jgi:hypothetical protein